ncbi:MULTISPECIES: hypothetical protein [Kamptonema]|uniref:hypothetical protein n=1 Tax=Kamptonema TaxID=1501433 RepID=UPI0001DAC7F4|nr:MULTISPECIES: hypothetical protein [Kamptonema]CBN54946.1 hypothetical protein OSCI_1340005 [Kamptonema sp. PCC 6506]
MKKHRKPITVRAFNPSTGTRSWWERTELKLLLGGRKPMSEATFKRRLSLLEECPEFSRKLHERKFSDFHKWCLVTLEKWLIEANYRIDPVHRRLIEQGLPTHEYFQNRTQK